MSQKCEKGRISGDLEQKTAVISENMVFMLQKRGKKLTSGVFHGIIQKMSCESTQTRLPEGGNVSEVLVLWAR